MDNHTDEIVSTGSAKDMKKKIKSPELLAGDYALYKKELKKVLIENKKNNSLHDSSFIFIADFNFEDQGEQPVLFLGSLNSQWKQAIRKDYKRRTTFVHGVCKLDTNPDKPILKLAYKGGKGAKTKNIKIFKKEQKKYFSDVVFEKYAEEGGKVLDKGNTVLKLDKEELGDKKSEEFIAVVEQFKSLRTQVPILKKAMQSTRISLKRKKIKAKLLAEIGEVENVIQAWKDAFADSDVNEEEQNTIANIEAFLDKLKSQLNNKSKIDSLGTSSSEYMITIELMSIESEIAALRELLGDQTDLEDRRVIVENIKQLISNWDNAYRDDTDSEIHKKEVAKIDHFKTYVTKASSQLDEREEILDFRELRRDYEDLAKRVEAYSENKMEQIHFFLQELYTIQWQFEDWHKENVALLSAKTKLNDSYLKYLDPNNEKKGKIPALKKNLLDRLKEILQADFNLEQIKAIVVEGATGYKEEDRAELEKQTTLSKDIYKKCDDKNLKKILEKRFKLLTKTDATDIAGKRYHITHIKLQIEQFLELNPDASSKSDLLDTIRDLDERIDKVAEIEADNDVYDDIIKKYNTFLDQKNTIVENLKNLNTSLDNKDAFNARVQEKKKERKKATEDKDKEALSTEIETFRKKRGDERKKITEGFNGTSTVFGNMETLLGEFGKLVEAWNQKHQGVRHYDTVERSKEVRTKREEIFAFYVEYRNKFRDFAKESKKRDGEFEDLVDYFEHSVNSHLKDYNPKDSEFEKIKTAHEILHLEDEEFLRQAEAAWAEMGIDVDGEDVTGYYNTKSLNKIKDKTSLWLFEAENLYHPSEELTKRVNLMQGYLESFKPLLEYIDIKTQHFALKNKEKQLLTTLEKTSRNAEGGKDVIKKLQKCQTITDPEEKEAYLDGIIQDINIGMYMKELSHQSFKFFQKKYNQEVLHIKKAPKFNSSNLDECINYYLGLFKYLRNEANRQATQDLQNTLSEMELNKKRHQDSQALYIKNEVTRLAEKTNHPIEKSLMDLINKIKEECDKKIENKEAQPEIDALYLELRKVRMSRSDALATFQKDLAKIESDDELSETEYEEAMNKLTKDFDAMNDEGDEKEESLVDQIERKEQEKAVAAQDLPEIQGFITDFYEGLGKLEEETSEVLYVLNQLENRLRGISSEKAAFVRLLTDPNTDKTELKNSISILKKYLVNHRKTLDQMVDYSITDLDQKANKKILKKLYSGEKAEYGKKLRAFINEKTLLHGKIVAAVKAKPYNKMRTKTIQKQLEQLVEWEALTMPIIGANAKEYIALLGEQAKELKQCKLILTQANATKDKDEKNYLHKDVNTYYNQIISLGDKIASLGEDELKPKILNLKEQFLYFKGALMQAIDSAYRNQEMTASEFCDQMGWTFNIQEIELSIDVFIENHYFDENKTAFIAEKKNELAEVRTLHSATLKTAFALSDSDIDDLLDNDTYRDKVTTHNQLLKFWTDSVERVIKEKERADILAKKDEHQDFIHKQLFKFRGISGDSKSLSLEGLSNDGDADTGKLKEKVELVCARAHRLLELGYPAEAKDLVRNIPATFLSADFVASKRIFDDIDAILQGEETEVDTNADYSGNVVEKNVTPVIDIIDSNSIEDFAKLATKNRKTIETFVDDYVKTGLMEMKYDADAGTWSLEITAAGEKLSPEKLEELQQFKEDNETALVGEAESGQKAATGAAVISTITTLAKMGLDVKVVVDDLLNVHEAKKKGDFNEEQRLAQLAGVKILSKAADWANQIKGMHDTFDGLAQGGGLGNLADTSPDVAKGILTIATTLFNGIAGQLAANDPAKRKNFYRNTIDNVLDLGGGVMSVLGAFEVPGVAVAADILALIKDAKVLAEKRAVFRAAKRTAHYMKVLSEAADSHESDYSDALKGIRRQARKERKNAHVDYVSAGIDLALDSVKLAGDITALTPAAPIGEGIAIGATIAKALKTGVMFGRDVYLEYKKSKEHKTVKKLLVQARAGDLDAISEIQYKSIHYAKAFLIYGVMDTAQDDGTTISLRKDTMAAAYIDQTGLNINEDTAANIIRDHIGTMEVGVFTHRFEKYHKEFEDKWGNLSKPDLVNKIKSNKLSIAVMDTDMFFGNWRSNDNFGDSLAAQITEFDKEMGATFKIFKELDVYKSQHQVINFIDKKVAKKGSLTKVTEELRALLQAAESTTKDAIANLTISINKSLELDTDDAFEKHKLLTTQRQKLEVLLTRIPMKALLT